MKYKYINMDELTRPKGHPYRLNSDCFITSISATLGFAYEDVYDDLFRLAQSKMLLPNDPYEVLPDYLAFYGFEYVQVTKDIKDLDADSSTLTVGELIEKHPDDTLLIVVRKHMFGFRLGTIYNDVRHTDGSTNYTEEDEDSILNSKVAYYYITRMPITHEKRFELTISLSFKGRYAKSEKRNAIDAFKILNNRSSKLVDTVYLCYGNKKSAILGVDKNGVTINEEQGIVILKGKFTVGVHMTDIESTSVTLMELKSTIELSDGTYMYSEVFKVKGIRCFLKKIPFKI